MFRLSVMIWQRFGYNILCYLTEHLGRCLIVECFVKQKNSTLHSHKTCWYSGQQTFQKCSETHKEKRSQYGSEWNGSHTELGSPISGHFKWFISWHSFLCTRLTILYYLRDNSEFLLPVSIVIYNWDMVNNETEILFWLETVAFDVV